MEIKTSEIPAKYEENSISKEFCQLTDLVVDKIERTFKLSHDQKKNLRKIDNFANNPNNYSIDINRSGLFANNAKDFISIKSHVSKISESGIGPSIGTTYQCSIKERNGEDTVVFKLRQNSNGTSIIVPGFYEPAKLGDNYNDRQIVKNGINSLKHQQNSTAHR